MYDYGQNLYNLGRLNAAMKIIIIKCFKMNFNICNVLLQTKLLLYLNYKQ